jgi:transcriptional regulator with XRE-family HTH domain
MTFGQRLTALRTAQSLTQVELAQRCGWPSVDGIAKMEQGKLDPTLSTLRALAAALGVSLDKFDYPLREPDGMTAGERFARRLKEVRESRGWSRMDMAKKLGYSKNAGAIGKWESGRVNPSDAVLQQLAKVLKVSVEDLRG